MKKYFIVLVIFVSTTNFFGQTKRVSEPILWRISMGLNFGATSPIPKPSEVTKVYVWYPRVNPSFSLIGIQHFNETHKHGIGFGFTIERKSFGATTRVKKLPFNSGGEKSFFSGDQNTTFDARYIGSMVFYNRNFNDRINIYSGIFMNLLLGADFLVKVDGDGIILSSDGKDSSSPNPGGISENKCNEHISPMDLGLVLGCDYFFTERVGLTFRFNAGLTNATKEEFYKISGQNLHNLYGFLGLNYRFN